MLRDTLTSASFLSRGFTTADRVNEMIREHESGRRDNSYFLWLLLILQLWLLEQEAAARASDSSSCRRACDSAVSTAAEETPHRTSRYLTNVLWTWMGVAAGIVSAFLLQPYTIRKLGDVDVGIWMLTMSVVEYYWLIDLGFRSATLKMSAEYRTLNRPDAPE